MPYVNDKEAASMKTPADNRKEALPTAGQESSRPKTFCFTVDDNIRFLKEITERRYHSLFDHPYLAMYKRLHEAFDLRVQLNLFYRMDGFSLSQMSPAYASEWQENADWLKLSFHSDFENEKPYEFSGYDEVWQDTENIHSQILRFASPASLAKTTTVHYCLATPEGLNALSDQGVLGLLGLFGTREQPRTSYGIGENSAQTIRDGEIVAIDGTSYASIDIVLNNFSKEDILCKLSHLMDRSCIRVMIHEQYFYADYRSYQPDFEEKLKSAFAFLKEHGYRSCFFEELIEPNNAGYPKS